MPPITTQTLTPVHQERILFLDLARGFTVLIMPAVHVLLLYSDPNAQQSIPGTILQLLAEGPGAQLFLFIMGVTIKLSTTLTPRKVLQRTIYLGIGAFGLNLFKFVIPLQLRMLPTSLLHDVPLTSIEFLFMGDIFHFAAIAYPLTYLISRLRFYMVPGVVLATAILIVSPWVWDVRSENNFVDQLLQYTGGQPPHMFFPLFPWLVYPLAGLILAEHIHSRKFLLFGGSILILSTLLPATTGFYSHYRTTAADTLFHLGIVILWLVLFRWLEDKMESKLLVSLLCFCSRHISLIYIIQWLLIFWCLPIAGYLELDLPLSILWMAIMTVTTLLLAKFIIHVQRKSL